MPLPFLPSDVNRQFSHALPVMRDSQLNACVRREWRKCLNETSVCTDVFRVGGNFFPSLNVSDLNAGDEGMAQHAVSCWHSVQRRPF